MKRLILIGIFLIALTLRLWQLDRYPAGFTPDEASFGYDAYSLLKTGKDQWGNVMPLTLRSFGDFKAPLYAYLTIPSVAIFGLNEFAVRLPNAVVGTLAVIITYLVTIKLFKWRRVLPLALLAALLLAISPWHISLSRGAFEANLTTFLMPVGIWAFLKGLENKRWMMVSALVFGLNLFSYHSARVVTPLLIIALLWWNRRKIGLQNYTLIRMSVWKYRCAVVIFIIFFSAMVYTMFAGGGARGTDIAIFNPTGGWGAVADRRYEAVIAGFPDIAERVFSNKFIYVISEFVRQYVMYLSPQFLFTQGAGEATYGMLPGVGVLYLFELPFVLYALLQFVKKPTREITFILFWVAVAPIPAALTKGPGYAANRIAVMMPAIQILSAYGGAALYELLSIKWLKGYFPQIKCCFVGLCFISLIFFLESYFYHAPRVNASSMTYGWKQLIANVQSNENNADQIIISRALSEPQIFVAFYTKWDPQNYQQQSQDWLRYENQHLLFIDQLGQYSLGNYIFRDLHYNDDKNLNNTILVGRVRDFPSNIATKFAVMYPDKNIAIQGVLTNAENK